MSDVTDLWVVIPVHNRREFTRACLASLSRQTDTRFNTVVVDDGSGDGTGEMIASNFPDVVVLVGDGDLWWSGASNLGVEHALSAGASHILLLNDDTQPCTDFVETFRRDAQSCDRCLLVARGIDRDTGTTAYSGERIDWLRARFDPVLELSDDGKMVGLHAVTHTPGRGLLVPVEAFQEVGLFDARRFPQTAADFDFSQRAARAGFSLFCDYDAVLAMYPQETGGHTFRSQPSVRNFWRHLFDRKGAGNLVYFWRYGVRNAPRRYVVPFLVVGSARRIGGYLRAWVRPSRTGAKSCSM